MFLEKWQLTDEFFLILFIVCCFCESSLLQINFELCIDITSINKGLDMPILDLQQTNWNESTQ